jgi:L-arabonate dehydrase
MKRQPRTTSVGKTGTADRQRSAASSDSLMFTHSQRCDKTTPMLMAAASVEVPAVMVTGGPMLNGKYRGADVGSGTHVWKFEEELKAGRMTQEECFFAEGCMARSNGHCTTMGTASTMACMAEALGMQLPGSATWPAVDARRFETAQAAGQRVVAMVDEELRPSRILTREAFENAIRVNAAIGGSTNAIIHLLAIAGRVGVTLEMDDFDRLARPVPTLVDLMPSGRFLMEDFCYAGGLPVVMKQLVDAGLLQSGSITVTGKSVADNVSGAECFNTEVITPVERPFQPAGTGTAVLFGNLCPAGAVIKQSAASAHLLTHRGRALVFDSAGTTTRSATTPTSMWTGTRSWSSAAPGPWVTPACRKWPTCRCRPKCSQTGSPTWSASATAG